jgi:glycosyltransferase involved in cell wall biosynthesis
MKKALFVTYENPFHATSGDALYTCNIIEALAQCCSVDIIYYDSNKVAPVIPADKRRMFDRITCVPFVKKAPWRLVLSVLPGMIKSRFQANYATSLADCVQWSNPDVVVINHFRMLFSLKIALSFDRPIIYVSHNVETAISKLAYEHRAPSLSKLVYYWDYIRTMLYERYIVRRCDSVLCISEGDRSHFASLYRKDAVLVRPFMRLSTLPRRDIDAFNRTAKTLLVVGSFVWGPKKDNITQLVRQFATSRLPQLGYVLQIVGRMEDALHHRLGAFCEAVCVVPNPQTVVPYYAQASIALIPEVIGGGLKLKVLEAATNGLAIFAVNGSISKGDFDPETHFVEAPSIEEMLKQVSERGADTQTLYDMAQRCRRYVSEQYSLEKARESIYTLVHAS